MNQIDWLRVATVFLASFLITAAYRRYAQSRQLLDRPGPRSSHSVPTPTGGGVGFVLVFVAAQGLLELHGEPSVPGFAELCIASLLVAGIGFLDDRHPVVPGVRLSVQVLAVLALYAGMGDFQFPESLVQLSVVLIPWVWLVNLFNFMDGIDGLAGSEALFVAVGAGAILALNGDSEALPSLLALAAAVAGFLVWNWPPARLFMGDAGSGFLGLILGGMILLTASGGAITPCSWMILLGVFISDATTTLGVRIWRGERWWEAHRTHAYQHASRRWGGHLAVTLACLGVNLLWLWPLAFYASIKQDLGAILTFTALAPLAALALWLRAGRPEIQH